MLSKCNLKKIWPAASLQSMPVCRVWPILTRSWVRQQARTSGAGALKSCKNRKVRHFAMNITAQTWKLQNLGGTQVRYLRHLRIILGAPLPYSAFWRVWPILTRSWVCKQSHTSGVGVQNHAKVVKCTATLCKQKIQNLRGARSAVTILCILDW